MFSSKSRFVRGLPVGSRARWLAMGFLLASAVMCVVLLRVRNLYDDELMSLGLVTDSVREMVAIAAEGDVHPPGMYLLGHLGWLATGSYRWLNLLPAAVLYGGLSWFVLRVVGLFRSVWGQVGFLLLATLHPELLLWSNTFRWYCPWTGLALIATVVALQPGVQGPGISKGRAVGLGVLLAGMFYLNYITVLFGVALAGAVLVRYRRGVVGRLGVAAVCFGVLVGPQIRTMVTVHLRNGAGQRYGIVESVLRVVQGLGESEAYLPWRPLGVGAAVVLVGLCAVGLRGGWADHAERGRRELVWLGVVFFGLIAFSGLGGKPRSGLVLVPLIAVWAGAGLDRLGSLEEGPGLKPLLGAGLFPRAEARCYSEGQEADGVGQERGSPGPKPLLGAGFFPRAEARCYSERRGEAGLGVVGGTSTQGRGGPRFRRAVLGGVVGLVVLWCGVGIGHEAGRYGLLKSEMNDRPEEVVRLVQETQSRRGARECATVVTYDSGVAFALAQARLAGVVVLSPYRGVPFLKPGSVECEPTELFVVRSYIGGTPRHVGTYTSELESAEQRIAGSPEVARLDPDPDAARKNWWARVVGARTAMPLPEDRFTVVYGAMGAAGMGELERVLVHFYRDGVDSSVASGSSDRGRAVAPEP